jgi:hypothetical protein
MIRPLIAVVGAALLLGACESQPQAVAPPQQSPPMAQGQSYLVFFDWDRSNLSPQALATISQAAAAYKSSGNARISAIGNTDTSGPPDYNMALSMRRAEAVKAALIQNGVPAASIETVGRGESSLLVQTADGVREPQNRRVEITGLQVSMEIFKDPKAYCQALMDKWRQYRTSNIDTPEAAAIAKCEAGDYQAGIPKLEDSLIRGNIPLPLPGYRWPGRSLYPS